MNPDSPGGEPHGLPGEPSEAMLANMYTPPRSEDDLKERISDYRELLTAGVRGLGPEEANDMAVRATESLIAWLMLGGAERASGAATHGEREAVTRVEVIDHRVGGSHHGRAFVAWDAKVELNYQDEGRTLKIFVGDHRPAPDADPGRSP